MALFDMSAWLIASCALLFYALAKRIRNRNKAPLPPGPRPLPIIGNALDVPTKDMPSTFRNMSAKYGDVVYLDALGQPMVILGTHDVAVELLEKRSSIYSDRGDYHMASLTGWDWVFTVQHYGPRWRQHRKAFHQHFSASAVVQYRELQEHEAHRFALRLMEDPKSFLQHIRFTFASTIMRVAYGIELTNMHDEYDEYVDIAEAAMDVFNKAFVPGKYLVETFPSLRFLPSWFPGARFKREGEAWMPAVQRLVNTPWERTLAKIQNGTAVPSITTSLVKNLVDAEDHDRAERETIARDVAAAVYAGGADTTLSAAQSFFLAMASYPEVQKKAQAELDEVVGQHRLPEISDRDSLPYLSALTKECLRWRSVVPLAFPHRSIEDDVFRGYFIPKGTLVIANTWAYSRNPDVYPDPESFTPERFLKDGQLNPDVLDPASMAFGYGRRICPGMHFAEAALFILAATALHTLTISAPLDADGNRVKLEGKMTSGVITYPEPFEVDIKPRAPWAETLVRESCDTAAE